MQGIKGRKVKVKVNGDKLVVEKLYKKLLTAMKNDKVDTMYAAYFTEGVFLSFTEDIMYVRDVTEEKPKEDRNSMYV